MNDYKIKSATWIAQLSNGEYVKVDEEAIDTLIMAEIDNSPDGKMQFGIGPGDFSMSMTFPTVGLGTWYKFLGDPRGECYAAPGWKDA